MGKDIVKIDRKDIEEAVSSCVNRLLCETMYRQYGDEVYKYKERPYIAGLPALYYYTDNLEYAKKHNDDGNSAEVDLSISLGATAVNLGDGDFDSLSDEDLIQIFGDWQTSPKYIEYYPDNKTTCIICASPYIFETIKDRDSEYLYSYHQGIDYSKIRLNWFDEVNSTTYAYTEQGEQVSIPYSRKTADILYDGHDIGTILLSTVNSASNLMMYLYTTLSSAERKQAVKHMDAESPVTIIYIDIRNDFRNAGLGPKILSDVIKANGEHKHYMIEGDVPNTKWDSQSDWDIIDKIATKNGFKLVAYNDKKYFYYK